MTDRSAFDPFSPPPAASVELTERAANVFAGRYVPDPEHVAFIASELEAGLARKGIDV